MFILHGILNIKLLKLAIHSQQQTLSTPQTISAAKVKQSFNEIQQMINTTERKPSATTDDNCMQNHHRHAATPKAATANELERWPTNQPISIQLLYWDDPFSIEILAIEMHSYAGQ